MSSARVNATASAPPLVRTKSTKANRSAGPLGMYPYNLSMSYGADVAIVIKLYWLFFASNKKVIPVLYSLS